MLLEFFAGDPLARSWFTGEAAAKEGNEAAEAPPATGEACPDLAPFDDLMVSFMAERDVPGAALAVVKDGRLVLARGYGWADREAKRPVEPGSLFRIASLSKPITAVAVIRLVQEGKLALDAKVFDLLGVEPFLPPGREVDPRLREITILQLLRHTAGFDRGRSFDPMFRSIEIARALGTDPPAGPPEIIRYMWGRPLDFDPGARHAYSNFGYCVLGRAIEKVTGETYEAYVRARILAPLGIRDMWIGKTLPEGRAENEVVYYGGGRKRRAVVGRIGEFVPPPYGAWYLEAMDAHGGWIASAVDLARFIAAFRDRERCPILKPESVRDLFARPPGLAGYDEDGKPKASYYACGWAVRPRGEGGAFTAWHSGSLDGTAALMVRRHDGLGWVVLFNRQNGEDGKYLADAIDPLLHRAAAAVKRWPEKDLFRGATHGAEAVLPAPMAIPLCPD
ncbi:MAG: beta-lactamase family protein [Planctomycetes bacterium]|nr:beta-lactamase family protein [Planctomycetota bacterium]